MLQTTMFCQDYDHSRIIERETGLEQLSGVVDGLIQVLIVQPLSKVLMALPGSLLHRMLLDDGRARLATEGVGHVGERCIHVDALTQVRGLVLEISDYVASHYLRVLKVGCFVIAILCNHLWACSVDDASHWLLILVFFLGKKVRLHKRNLLLLLILRWRLRLLMSVKGRC